MFHKRLSVANIVEGGDSFLADCDLRIDIVVPTSELQDALIQVQSYKRISTDETFRDPRAMTHLPDGGADVDGFASFNH